MPVSAPPTPKAPLMVFVYCRYVTSQSARRSITAARRDRSRSPPATNVSSRSDTPVGSSSLFATVWSPPSRSFAMALSVRSASFL